MVTVLADEDRRERRRKLGLPEELTEEEKAQEAAAAAQKAEAAKKKGSFVSVKPVSGKAHHAWTPISATPCTNMTSQLLHTLYA